MSEELEKIDILRRRFNVGYREAREALERADGDLVGALLLLEEQAKGPVGEILDRAPEMWGQVKDAWQRAQGTRIRVKDGERTVFEVPAPMGALGVLGALASSELAVLAAVGAVTAMAKKYTIEVETPDGPDGPEREEEGEA
ncbi:MAG: DUF4342 domain-containing protein [Peptococcaceae bacterium]|jgi:hypothetical protein|nr:DUF4342 domain-containing protein [Peptococcaceae bacterium]